MAVVTQEHATEGRKALPSAAREAMERLNAEAGKLNIWLRTQANAPSQRSWFRDTALDSAGQLASGRVAANQMKALPHIWRWQEIGPYLDRISEIARDADVPPIEFADRQQFLLTNPGLGGRLQVTSVIRCAISVYNPGDVAPVHMHTPNASRTILSKKGGYTTIEGERCVAERGDLIFTPTGTWHDHGNEDAEPVKWADILDFPLLEFLDCNWLDEGFDGALEGNSRAQAPLQSAGYSQRLYAKGGMLPSFVPPTRGVWQGTTPMLHYRGVDIRASLDGLRAETGDAYEGIRLRFVNPTTAGPIFPTLD
jgi:gentisate 1,2-dioxygenase